MSAEIIEIRFGVAFLARRFPGTGLAQNHADYVYCAIVCREYYRTR